MLATQTSQGSLVCRHLAILNIVTRRKWAVVEYQTRRRFYILEPILHMQTADGVFAPISSADHCGVCTTTSIKSLTVKRLHSRETLMETSVLVQDTFQVHGEEHIVRLRVPGRDRLCHLPLSMQCLPAKRECSTKREAQPCVLMRPTPADKYFAYGGAVSRAGRPLVDIPTPRRSQRIETSIRMAASSGRSMLRPKTVPSTLRMLHAAPAGIRMLWKGSARTSNVAPAFLSVGWHTVCEIMFQHVASSSSRSCCRSDLVTRRAMTTDVEKRRVISSFSEKRHES